MLRRTRVACIRNKYRPIDLTDGSAESVILFLSKRLVTDLDFLAARSDCMGWAAVGSPAGLRLVIKRLVPSLALI